MLAAGIFAAAGGGGHRERCLAVVLRIRAGKAKLPWNQLQHSTIRWIPRLGGHLVTFRPAGAQLEDSGFGWSAEDEARLLTGTAARRKMPTRLKNVDLVTAASRRKMHA